MWTERLYFSLFTKKIESFAPLLFSWSRRHCLFTESCENRLSSFCVILLTDKQTNERENTTTSTSRRPTTSTTCCRRLPDYSTRCVFYAATKRPLSLYMISSAQPSSPSWHTVPQIGLDRVRLQSVRALTLFWCKRFGFCDNNLQAIEVLFSEADDAFFQRIINNNLHVLQTFFTGITWSTVPF